MATVGPVHLDIRVGDTAPMLSSLRSVFEVLAASRGALERVVHAFPDLFDAEGSDGATHLRDDVCDLLVGEAATRVADGALEVFVRPSERYLELVAAVAGDGDIAAHLDGNLDSHGWPVLSVAGDTATVAEAGGATNAPGGGLAA